MNENGVEASALSLKSPFAADYLDPYQVSSASGVTSTQSSDWKMERKRRRREEATLRERKRMHVLNAAFEQLQAALPFVPEGSRMPKMTIMESALNYIQDLMEMIEDYDAEKNETKRNVDKATATDDDGVCPPGEAYCQCPCHNRKYIY